MNHPDRDKYDLSSLTDIAAGGAPRPVSHVERLQPGIPEGAAGARLWPDRDERGRLFQLLGQLCRQAGFDRPRAKAVRRTRDPRRGRRASALRRTRRDRDQVSGEHQMLLGGPGSDQTLPSPPTAISRPATSAMSTRTAICSSSTARRTSSFAAARISPAPRWRRKSTPAPPSPRPACSECLTIDWARCRWPSIYPHEDSEPDGRGFDGLPRTAHLGIQDPGAVHLRRSSRCRSSAPARSTASRSRRSTAVEARRSSVRCSTAELACCSSTLGLLTRPRQRRFGATSPSSSAIHESSRFRASPGCRSCTESSCARGRRSRRTPTSRCGRRKAHRSPRSRGGRARRCRSGLAKRSSSISPCATAIRASDKSLENLIALGCERILVAPLYPQYCAATTATAMDAVYAALAKMRRQPALRSLPPYYDDRTPHRRIEGEPRTADRGARFRAAAAAAQLSRNAAADAGARRPLPLSLPEDGAAALRTAQHPDRHCVPVALRAGEMAGAGDGQGPRRLSEAGCHPDRHRRSRLFGGLRRDGRGARNPRTRDFRC